jgi:hypothetical protein
MQIQYHYFTTDTGNFFIKANVDGQNIYFFMNPNTGQHLDKKRDFHEEIFYQNCLTDWKKTEESLPEKHFKAAGKIVEQYFGDRSVMNEKMVTKSAGYTLANAFETARPLKTKK